jgi:hypothetical protein
MRPVLVLLVLGVGLAWLLSSRKVPGRPCSYQWNRRGVYEHLGAGRN